MLAILQLKWFSLNACYAYTIFFIDLSCSVCMQNTYMINKGNLPLHVLVVTSFTTAEWNHAFYQLIEYVYTGMYFSYFKIESLYD